MCFALPYHHILTCERLHEDGWHARSLRNGQVPWPIRKKNAQEYSLDMNEDCLKRSLAGRPLGRIRFCSSSLTSCGDRNMSGKSGTCCFGGIILCEFANALSLLSMRLCYCKKKFIVVRRNRCSLHTQGPTTITWSSLSCSLRRLTDTPTIHS